MDKQWREKLVFLVKFLVLIGLGFFILKFEHVQNLKIPNIINAILIFGVTHLLIDFNRIIIIGFYISRKKLPRNTKDNFTIGINQIATIGTFIAFVIAFLLALNITPKEALTAISIVAAAIAILFKDFVSNVLNGMILMFSDQISLNDRVKIKDHKGRIVDITLFNLHLYNEDDDLLYLPNNMVMNSEVVNYTKRAEKKVSIDFEISYQYLKDVEELEEYLVASLKEYSEHIEENSYVIKTVKIHKDYAQLKVQYLLKAASDEDLERKIRRRTVRKVVEFIADKSHQQKGGNTALLPLKVMETEDN